LQGKKQKIWGRQICQKERKKTLSITSRVLNGICINIITSKVMFLAVKYEALMPTVDVV